MVKVEGHISKVMEGMVVKEEDSQTILLEEGD